MSRKRWPRRAWQEHKDACGCAPEARALIAERNQLKRENVALIKAGMKLGLEIAQLEALLRDVDEAGAQQGTK